jgi:hypothetical protein
MKKLTHKEFIKRQERRNRQRMHKRMKEMYEKYGTYDSEILKRFDLPSSEINLDNLKSRSPKIQVVGKRHLKKGSRRHKAMLRTRQQEDLTKRVEHHIVSNSLILQDDKIDSCKDLADKSKDYGQNSLKIRRNARLKKQGKSKQVKKEHAINFSRVNWEFLPSGNDWVSFERHFNQYVKKNKKLIPINEIEEARKRFEKIKDLKPQEVYKGIETFSDYYALLFKETNKVILESVVYGNAIYVIEGNWKTLSRKTKSELKEYPSTKVISHRHDWFLKLKNYLQIGYE